MNTPIRVLLIEDDLIFAEMIRDMLENSQMPSFQMEHQDSIAGALEYLNKGEPQVVLLDLWLPDSKGLDTFQRIHTWAPQVPVIVMSGMDEESMAVQAVRRGAQDYLVKKNVDRDLLSRAILYARERHHLQTALEKARDEMEQRVTERTADISNINRKLEAAEEKTRLAYLELDQVFNASVPLCVIGIDQQILRVNSKFSQLFEMPREEIVGKGCCQIWDIPTCHTAHCPLKTVTRGETPEYFEVSRQNGLGKTRWYSVTPSPYRDTKGKLVGIVASLIDISERKEAEEQIKLNQEQLIQADKMASLGILVSGVAHEINNPNAFITLNAPIFKRVWENLVPILDDYNKNNGEFFVGHLPFAEIRKMVPELLDGMTDGARRINRIVKSLKDFARKEPAELTEEVNLNQVVRSALSLLENMINKSTDHFSVRYGDGVPIFKGNSQQIEQVVVNILINACQALPGKDKGIILSTRYNQSQEEIELKIKDEGTGIPVEMQKKIFDPFFTTKRNADGTGLGLSITTNIIQSHKGTISIHSEPGEGSTFTITLPVQPN